MKLSDRLWDIVSQYAGHVFMVAGGGAMHLVDSLNGRMEYTCCLHEQAAGFAAVAYSQFKGLGVCLVTSGPGGTNAITACASAWCSSRPVLFISGQVQTHQLKTKEQRFNGIQELDIISMVKPITKLAARIFSLSSYDWCFEWAVVEAKTARQGPVWLDIPLDVQATEV